MADPRHPPASEMGQSGGGERKPPRERAVRTEFPVRERVRFTVKASGKSGNLGTEE